MKKIVVFTVISFLLATSMAFAGKKKKKKPANPSYSIVEMEKTKKTKKSKKAKPAALFESQIAE